MYRTFLERRLDLLRDPLNGFVHTQATASGLLLLSLVFALSLANSGAQEFYQSIQGLPIGVRVGEWRIVGNLMGWVNNGLIAVFFFLVGLEIKREVLAGELRSPARLKLVIAAALGGMIVPAGIYLIINLLHPDGIPHGWGIPMATDTALAIGVLAVLSGSALPRALTVFLVGLAIVDDIGSVLVVTLFYTDSVQLQPLLLCLLLLTILGFTNFAGVRHPMVYATGAVALWAGLHLAGVHASAAGILAALTVPARPRITPHRLALRLQRFADQCADRIVDVLADEHQHRQIEDIERQARHARTPLRSWEHGLQLPVGLVILPFFAFLNSGIPIETSLVVRQVLQDPVALGILFGLLLGKPAGICSACWLATRTKWVRFPVGFDFPTLLAIGLLAGIGFTMSTFIANLALATYPERIETAKLAIILTSTLAGVGAALLLRRMHRP